MLPIGDGDFTRLVVFYKDGAMIPTPSIVRRMIEQRHLREIGPGFFDQRPSPLVQGLRGIDAHLFKATDVRDDLGKFRRNRPKITGPRFQIVGPRKPYGFLRLPLRRHSKTKCGGGLFSNGHGSVAETFREVAVSVDTAVAQKRPVRPRDIDFVELDGH